MAHHAGDGDGTAAEERVGAELSTVERAVEGGRKQRARRLDRHALAGAIGAASPAGVDQPARHAMLGDQALEELAIFRGMARQEGRAEAGGKFRRRLGNAALGAGDLGRVAGEEVVHRLRRRQPGDGRHDAEGVGGQHDDVLRLPGAAGRRGVGDEIERVGRARIFGLRLVVEVGLSRHSIEDDVFQNRAEARACGEDLRLGLGREPDAFGVAAAFEIEDAVRTPAVLVVADQRALRIGRQRRLAGAGEAEEEGGRPPARLAEQCIGITPREGSRWFSAVNTAFFISPA